MTTPEASSATQLYLLGVRVGLARAYISLAMVWPAMWP